MSMKLFILTALILTISINEAKKSNNLKKE